LPLSFEPGGKDVGEDNGPQRTFIRRRLRFAQILELIFEDNRLNVYAGELDVRPPAAPTTHGGTATGAPPKVAGVSGLVELLNVRNSEELACQNHGGYSPRVGDVFERIGVKDGQVCLLAYSDCAFFAIST
jgi:hypothetical protein